MYKENVNRAQKIIKEISGYKFKNNNLLLKALTHPAIVSGRIKESYERLEYVGDSIINFVIAEELTEKFRNLTEGQLTELRQKIVSEEPLCRVSIKSGLGDCIIKDKNIQSDKVLSNVIESITAAIYFDSKYAYNQETGFLNVKMFVLNVLKDEIINAFNFDDKNPISELNERFPGPKQIEYVDENQEGESHCPVFTVSLYIKGIKYYECKGKSKKEARKNCARKYLSENP